MTVLLQPLEINENVGQMRRMAVDSSSVKKIQLKSEISVIFV